MGDYVSKENNTHVSLTATTLSRRLTVHVNDSGSIALRIKTHSIRKSKFRKFLVENAIIIAHENYKLQLQILEARHIKTKKKINWINFENSENVLKCLRFF